MEGGAAAWARDDEHRLRAFAAVYDGGADPLDALRWLDDPDAPGRDGGAGPGVALQEARRALYRPGAGAVAQERYRQLDQALAREQGLTRAALARLGQPASPGSAAGRPGEEAPRRTAPASARRGALLGAAAVLLVGAAITGGLLHGAAGPAPRPTVQPFDAPLAQVLAAHPGRLPAEWRGSIVVSTSDQLDGAVALLAPAGQQGRLLLVVRCPPSDRSFQADISSGALRQQRFGACGRLQTVELPRRPDALMKVVITTRGVDAFSGALLRR